MRRVVAVIALMMMTTACGGGSTEGLFGADLFERSCAVCHRSDGSGGSGPPIGPGSNAMTLSDEQLAGVIRVGPGSMPSFSRFSDDQVASLVAYVRALQEPSG